MRLSEIAQPVVDRVCELRMAAAAGAPLDAQSVRSELLNLLERMREQGKGDSELLADISKVVLPLVFFIDYNIKEGPFPFKREWVEMARDYNELSGDEKFFDLLDENINDPSAAATERLWVFYQCLAAGFDGCHQADHGLLLRKMKVCALRLGVPADRQDDRLFPEAYASPPKPARVSDPLRRWRRTLYYALGALAAAFAVNVLVFHVATREFRDSLYACLAAALESGSAQEVKLSFSAPASPSPASAAADAEDADGVAAPSPSKPRKSLDAARAVDTAAPQP